MNTQLNPDSELDSFETRLLAELRHRVSSQLPAETAPADTAPDETSSTETSSTETSSVRPSSIATSSSGAVLQLLERSGAEPRTSLDRRRISAVAAALVGATVVGGALLWPGGGNAAYSVGEGNADEIIAEIFRPEDSAGLERALEEHGISADITYLPGLQKCAPGRYTPVERPSTGLQIEVGGGELKVTLPPDAVRPGETFVLTWSARPMTPDELAKAYQYTVDAEDSAAPGSSDRADRQYLPIESGEVSSVDAEVATGSVRPCEPVPSDNPAPPQ